MSKALGMRCVWGLCGVLASALVVPSLTRAEVTSDLSGSVVVWPKVVWTGNNSDSDVDRDTVIQLTNTTNQLVHVWCFYIDASRINPDFPPGPLNPTRWQVTDFRIWLTKQQPTHWVVSQGRTINPNDGFGEDGSGLDPGGIPPVAPGFEGELKCVQTDTDGGAPMGGNALKGEALLRREDGDVSKYNAITVLANPDLFGGDPVNELRLDNTATNDGEFNSCPNTLLLNHFLDGSDNPVVLSLNPAQCVDRCLTGTTTCTISGATCNPANGNDDCLGNFCPIRTDLTLVPCSEDLENVVPSRVTVQFEIINELEQVFSASTTVECYLTTRLADITSGNGKCSRDGDTCQTDEQCISTGDGFCEKTSPFSLGNLGAGAAFTRITPVDLDGGVIGVAEETHYVAEATIEQTAGERYSAQASWNLQHDRFDPSDVDASGNPVRFATRFDATVNVPGGPVVDKITLPGSGQ
jgi:hypothetical protein